MKGSGSLGARAPGTPPLDPPMVCYLLVFRKKDLYLVITQKLTFLISREICRILPEIWRISGKIWQISREICQISYGFHEIFQILCGFYEIQQISGEIQWISGEICQILCRFQVKSARFHVDFRWNPPTKLINQIFQEKLFSFMECCGKAVSCFHMKSAGFRKTNCQEW